jgi:hypothetical protein
MASVLPNPSAFPQAFYMTGCYFLFKSQLITSFKKLFHQVLVAYASYPNYSGGRDQEDCGLKAACANGLQGPISKIPNTKRAGGVAQSVGPEFKPQYHKTTTAKKLFLTYHHKVAPIPHFILFVIIGT